MKLLITNKQYSTIEVNPSDLADQITLIDLSIFKSIKRDELISVADYGQKFSKRNNLSPNIVTMNRQFNQISFWVVSQILSNDSARVRAELMSNFIKTARRLYQLNNLHSSNAVISALLSSSIFRLEKTWYFVRKKYPKEKIIFDELRELYSDNNNYELLRNHLSNRDLPCIPYLGTYYRDLIYIAEAHPQGTMQRTNATTKILETIGRFQSSQYEQLISNPEVSLCVLSSRYIDELQKLVEDENYRRSLELEPPENLSDNQTNSTVNGSSRGPSRSAILLANLSSLLQSAVVTTSNKFGGSSPRRCSNDSQKSHRYLIDDSYVTCGVGPTYPQAIPTRH